MYVVFVFCFMCKSASINKDSQRNVTYTPRCINQSERYRPDLTPTTQGYAYVPIVLCVFGRPLRHGVLISSQMLFSVWKFMYAILDTLIYDLASGMNRAFTILSSYNRL